MDPDPPEMPAAAPPVWRWVLGFLLVGACWGLTTPIMRKGAIARDQKPHVDRPFLTDVNQPWVKRKVWSILYAVLDLLRTPAYAIPLLLNVTGSVWFFILVGQAGMLDRDRTHLHRTDFAIRAKPDGPHYQFPCLPLHSAW